MVHPVISRIVGVGLTVILGLSPVYKPSLASAEGLRLSGASSKSRVSQFQRQTQLIDRRLAGQYAQSARLRPNAPKVASFAALTPAPSRAIPAYRGRYKGQYLAHAKAMAQKHGIPENLFLRLVQQESGWNPSARSNKGAMGLAQLMPGTAAKLGVNPADPRQNLEGGARYLKMMYSRFGDWRLALAAYNAGPEAVARYKGIPPYSETKNYVRVIHGG
ncbi:lytic transglycosylase domain-containing protein [Paracoccus pacificus]|uniref:Lytic transglycosylase domain-containing protein n=1 Tax=Paracoccus pacificus TaxID=1463598 RepID=A0ABW4R5F8_9RHOB